MGGNTAISAPWDDVRRYRAPLLARVSPRHGEALWARRRRYLERRLERIQRLCEEARERDAGVEWTWVAAILWDELARRDITERLTDWALGQLGRDPSVGAYQVTGGTAQQVVRFLRGRAAWADRVEDVSPRAMRGRLMEFDFATRVVVGRSEQILRTWRDAGHDPFAPGGLGPHRVSPLALVGTLYSQGLGRPKPDPQANPRGLQVERFAAQMPQLSCT